MKNQKIDLNLKGKGFKKSKTNHLDQSRNEKPNTLKYPEKNRVQMSQIEQDGNIVYGFLDVLQDIRDNLDIIALYFERKGKSEGIIKNEDIENE